MQVWALTQKMVGQLRVSPRFEKEPIIFGIDLNVAFTMGAALGVPEWAIAEWMPSIEAAMVAGINERLSGGRDG